MPGLFLTAGADLVTSADFQSVISALQNQISVETVVGILGTCVTAGVGFAFMWWGVRKVTRALMSAFKKGKISL